MDIVLHWNLTKPQAIKSIHPSFYIDWIYLKLTRALNLLHFLITFNLSTNYDNVLTRFRRNAIKFKFQLEDFLLEFIAFIRNPFFYQILVVHGFLLDLQTFTFGLFNNFVRAVKLGNG